jgi:endonuclease-3 related protein
LVQANWQRARELVLTRGSVTVIFRLMGNAAEKYAPAIPLGVRESAYAEAPSGVLLRYYEAMAGALGPMRWWPAQTPFEVIVGAILTQSTAWGNVERAIANLRSARLLTPSAMLRVPTPRLAALVRPSGYFRQKAKKLKAFVRFLQAEYGGSLKRMFHTPTLELRAKLLSVHGIGPETADSILLYAGNHPVFVVDAYTHRIFGRHGITDGKADYENVRAFIEQSIPRRPDLFNEFHALIVNTGKNWCRKSAPRCGQCPLRSMLPANSPFSISNPALPEGASLSGSLG